MTSRRDLSRGRHGQAGSCASTLCRTRGTIARVGQPTSACRSRSAVGATMLCGIITAASLAWTSIRRRWSALSAPDYTSGPGCARRCGALCVYDRSGALLVAGSLLAHAGQVDRTVPDGGWRGVRHPLLVVGAVVRLNAVIAAASFWPDRALRVGTGTSVTAFSASRGTPAGIPDPRRDPERPDPLGSRGAPARRHAACCGMGDPRRLAQGPAAVDFGTLLSRLAVAAAGAEAPR